MSGSASGNDNKDWFVDEVRKIGNKMIFYFKSTNKVIIITQADEEDYRNNKTCQFCEKHFESDKVRDLCHLKGRYRGPAHNICINNVTQDQSNFIPFIFHNYSDYDSNMFFKKLVEKKNDKVKFDIIPKTNEKYISVTYDCIRFIDSYRFLSSSLDSLVKIIVKNSNKTLKNLKIEIVDNDEILNIVNEVIEEDKTVQDVRKDYPDKIRNLEEALLNYMGENDLNVFKKQFADNWKFSTKKLAYPYEYFNGIDVYQKPVKNLKREDFSSKLKNDYPDDEEKERTKELNKKFNIKIGEELTQLFSKTDVLLFTCSFEKFKKVSVNGIGINPL